MMRLHPLTPRPHAPPFPPKKNTPTQVYRHASAKGTTRVSLVIEQYAWPERWASLLPPFWVKGQVKDNDALLPLWLDGSLPLPLEVLPRDRRPWGKQVWPERD